LTEFTLESLAEVVAQRASSSAERSYTKSLLDAGPNRCARKFGEEAVELLIAAASGEKPEVVAEAADVLFHMLVLLRSRDVDYAEVMAELARRTGTSGHAEKASRGAK
jgi:phosphoribosyl-ATP pyrophosphohydrolase